MYHPDSVVNLQKKILKDAGLEYIRFHDLRHTFATLAIQNGVDIKTVSSMLGHYDAGFTLRTDTHATAQMKQDAADTIGGVISRQMRKIRQKIQGQTGKILSGPVWYFPRLSKTGRKQWNGECLRVIESRVGNPRRFPPYTLDS